jgi:hypothetical protein
MSDTITLDFLARQQAQILVEQRMLRSLVDPLPARLSALEARFSALEARFGGVEEGINGIGLALRHQSEMLAQLVGVGT